jgi:hypothetical protein
MMDDREPVAGLRAFDLPDDPEPTEIDARSFVRRDCASTEFRRHRPSLFSLYMTVHCNIEPTRFVDHVNPEGKVKEWRGSTN